MALLKKWKERPDGVAGQGEAKGVVFAYASDGSGFNKTVSPNI